MNHDDEASLLLYLYHELDADERAALERRLSADPLLRVQLSELRRVRFEERHYYDHPGIGVIAVVTSGAQP